MKNIELFQSTGLYPNYLNADNSNDIRTADDFTNTISNLIEIISNSTILFENDTYEEKG